jgi:hypothetical protein
MWRSDDEMLDEVRRRAGQVQERRRALGTGVAAAVVLVCAAAVAVARGDGGDRQLNVAASGGGSASASGVEPSTFPVPGTFVPQPGVPALPVDAPGQSPTTTVPVGLVPGAVPTTTVAPGPSGGGGGGEPPPTSVAPAPAGRAEPCSPGDAVAVTTVDKPTYVPGERVFISGTLRNTSGRDCFSPTFGQHVAVTDGTGASLWGVGTSSTGPCDAARDCSWPAGAEAEAGSCWDQRNTQTGIQAPVGTYTAKVSWTGPVVASASVTFEIVPDPAAPTTTVPASRCT